MVTLDSSAAWQSARRMVSANRDMLAAIAGVFFLLPGLVAAVVLPSPQLSNGMDQQQIADAITRFYASAGPFMLALSLPMLVGYLTLLAVLLDRDRPSVGAAIGRAADVDFRLFGASVEKLDDGVVLSVGSAIMAPQVFEKSLSCVNNLRLQAGRGIVGGHTIYVLDIQDGGNWDWTQGEPPKDNPAYYLRFCKSFSRMGGTMRYVQIDNVAFLHSLLHALKQA